LAQTGWDACESSLIGPSSLTLDPDPPEEPLLLGTDVLWVWATAGHEQRHLSDCLVVEAL